ncbi:MAG: hypothetical protein AAF490_12815 [Chloroflexota bacterium]
MRIQKYLFMFWIWFLIIGCTSTTNVSNDALIEEEATEVIETQLPPTQQLPEPTSTTEIDALSLLQTAEENFFLLTSYSISGTHATTFGTFPEDSGDVGFCDVDISNILIYCETGFDLFRKENRYWRASLNEPWIEPTESTTGRMDVLIRAFEAWAVGPGLVQYRYQGFPTVEILSIVKELQFSQETTFDGFEVVELTFSIDDAYHDQLNYTGGLATQTMGTMREAANMLEGSGNGYVLIDKEQTLVRFISIESEATVDDFEATTSTTVTISNFNEPMDFSEIENQIQIDIGEE